jgi:hypothetical protein
MLLRILLVLICLAMVQPVMAQEPATPILVQPPTSTPSPLPPTEQPSRTPTSLGPASVEALSSPTNVRSQPDITAEIVGQIGPGQTYAVIGKRFEWYQIQFPDAPGGVGWVHQSVVQIRGDPNLIPDFSEVPTENPTITSGRETAEAITRTPGGNLTLTAQARITPTGIFTVAPQAGGAGDNPNIPVSGNPLLPTFTFPAVTATPLDLVALEGQAEASSDGGLPPIVLIVGLLGAGSLGLFISMVRRR